MKRNYIGICLFYLCLSILLWLIVFQTITLTHFQKLIVYLIAFGMCIWETINENKNQIKKWSFDWILNRLGLVIFGVLSILLLLIIIG